ncbi:hypothetical protein IFM89_037268 [Coptis chinensis]|uniref:NB-ARC domain-containing protein n=1 Tax=Coptis chinensis TaxID=261450 RepID=A0A835I5H9_9MAGN|nr:hypothetical protein IFM89_037268 [Coptis chinensis]
MDILRSKCEDLIAKETDIKEDLSRTEGQRRRPREQVISWLEHVEIIKNQVGVLEKSFEKNNKLCFANLYHQHKHSKLIVKMTEEVDRLQESSQFFEGLVSSDEPFVEQVPYRPQILAAPTILKKIWENLMDCRVGIVGIWGLGISRNATMMTIRNMLAATNIFNKIIWVHCSEDMSVDEVWDVIGMQLDVFIPMHEDYRSQAARVLNSLEKVLFIFYDMSKTISFKKLGIPLPNESNGCKIMVTSDFWEVRRRMETNQDVDFFEEVFSKKESWTSFDSKGFTPDIQRSAWQMVPEQQSFVAVQPLFGSSIQTTLNEIWDNLMDPKVGIIGVYGKGGVGKTTAMMNTNNRLLATKMFNKIIWVNMSKDMSLEKVQRDIAMQLNMEFEDEASQAAYLLRSLKKVKKFLIIFDDVWQPISLMKIGIPLPNEDNGCKIVVTTRFWSVCWRLKTNKNIEVDVLTKTEAWDLFVSTVGEEVLTPDIQPIAREMVRECDLLPVFIISLGHAMRNAIKIEVWDKFLEELTQTKIRNMEERNLILMRLVYSRLKDDAIRNCFLYSAFFPEDYLFESEELIRNHINTLDDIEYYCPDLSTLLLQDNPLSHISSSFFYMMPAIEVLDMSYSCITELPSSLAELLNLRVLFLQYCKSLKKIPSLENLKKLRVLNLRGASIEELPHGMDGLLSLRSLDLSETTSLKNIQVGLISSLCGLEELQMKGSLLCNMDSPMVADCLKEMRCLEHLAILTLSIVGFEDHLDTIMSLQERNLKRFTINLYGSTGDFI